MSFTFFGKSEVKQASLSAVVIRADGSREELGVISYYSKNPFKQIWYDTKRYLKNLHKEE